MTAPSSSRQCLRCNPANVEQDRVYALPERERDAAQFPRGVRGRGAGRHDPRHGDGVRSARSGAALVLTELQSTCCAVDLRMS
jgi:hypothetical protein